MKERPILFSAPIVRAILEGRKTQTRRLVKMTDRATTALVGAPRPAMEGDRARWCTPALDSGADYDAWNAWCPYGEPGDRLWVRETFAIECNVEDNPPPHDDGRPIRRYDYADGDLSWEQPHYRATDPDPDLCIADKFGEEDCGVRWKPSIHMPRWASRITLRVTSVRVERLQDITEEDAIAEGMTVPPDAIHDEVSHIVSFQNLWEIINGSRAPDGGRAPWASNPWVWVVGFEREVTP